MSRHVDQSPDEVRNALHRVRGHLASVMFELGYLHPGPFGEALAEVELAESIASCSEVVQELLEEIDDDADSDYERARRARLEAGGLHPGDEGYDWAT